MDIGVGAWLSNCKKLYQQDTLLFFQQTLMQIHQYQTSKVEGEDKVGGSEADPVGLSLPQG